ncbi:MAG: aldo/keto reductase, partial [Beijerinckiaceae bacterium]
MAQKREQIFVEAHGARIPAIGLGTWDIPRDTLPSLIAGAINHGYRHLDTAARYDNETEVGEGIRLASVPRADLHVTTKVWYDRIDDGDLQTSAEESLKRLNLDYVDLLLIHWPNRDIPLARSIRALNDAKKSGLARHVGVSNFTRAMVDEAVRLSDAPLVTNQCENHPFLDQSKLIETCRKYGISFTSYTPLGRGRLSENPAIVSAAQAHGKTPNQIVLRWHVQSGCIAIPRSSKLNHVIENFSIFDF